jgi:hypothetical protein
MSEIEFSREQARHIVELRCGSIEAQLKGYSLIPDQPEVLTASETAGLSDYLTMTSSVPWKGDREPGGVLDYKSELALLENIATMARSREASMFTVEKGADLDLIPSVYTKHNDALAYTRSPAEMSLIAVRDEHCGMPEVIDLSNRALLTIVSKTVGCFDEMLRNGKAKAGETHPLMLTSLKTLGRCLNSGLPLREVEILEGVDDMLQRISQLIIPRERWLIADYGKDFFEQYIYAENTPTTRLVDKQIDEWVKFFRKKFASLPYPEAEYIKDGKFLVNFIEQNDRESRLADYLRYPVYVARGLYEKYHKTAEPRSKKLDDGWSSFQRGPYMFESQEY